MTSIKIPCIASLRVSNISEIKNNFGVSTSQFMDFGQFHAFLSHNLAFSLTSCGDLSLPPNETKFGSKLIFDLFLTSVKVMCVAP